MSTVRRLLIALLALPVQLVVLLVLSAAELVAHLRAVPPASEDRDCPRRDRCSIVVLSWNGRRLLEQSLPPLLRAVGTSGGAHQLIVADNGSEDDTVEWLAAEYPEVEVLSFDRNLGFGEGNNRALEACRHDIVVLLNNDMIVEPGFLEPLLEPFEDEDVFAVTAQICFPDGRRREETGNTTAAWRRGFLELAHAPLRRAHHTRRFLPVLWAGGGSSAFDRKRFLELGGFASIYSPAYFEDTELSYRAWRRGWKVLLAAESRVLHKHRSTTGRRFSPGKLHEMIEARRLFFIWRNLDLRSLAGHLPAAPAHLLSRLPIRSYLGALARVPAIAAYRSREPARRLADSELFRLTSDPLQAVRHLRLGSRSADGVRPRLLMVSAYLPHEGRHGGAGRVFRLLQALCGRFRVTLVSFVESPAEEALASDLDGLCDRVVTVGRGRFESVSPFPYEPFEEFNSPDMRAALRQLLAEEDFDLVDFEWTQMAQFADLFEHLPRLLTEVEVNWAAHRTRIPLIASPFGRLHQRYRTLQTLYREVEMCRRVNCVVCVTEEDRGYLRPVVRDTPIEVVPTGVDLSYFRPDQTPPEPESLLYVGAFRHDPNIDAMLYFCSAIWPKLKDNGLSARLYIVGSSPGPEIRALASDPAITVTGFVEDLREYYRRCETVIVPLRTGVGIRGKVLEAWAMERPVIASRLACQGLRAEHGTNVLVAETPDEFVSWIAALAACPEFGRHLGRQGRRTAERFYDWESIGEQAAGLCGRMLDAAASPSAAGPSGRPLEGAP